MNKEGHIGVVLNASNPIQKNESIPISKIIERKFKKNLAASSSPKTRRDQDVPKKLKIHE